MDHKPEGGHRVRVTGRTWHGQIGEVIEDLPLRPGRAKETARVRLLGRSEALTFELADLESEPESPRKDSVGHRRAIERSWFGPPTRSPVCGRETVAPSGGHPGGLEIDGASGSTPSMLPARGDQVRREEGGNE